MLIPQQQSPNFTGWMKASSGMFNGCVIVAGVCAAVCMREIGEMPDRASMH